MEIYLKDSYKKELETKVKEVNGKEIILYETIFYPESGGQAFDMGKLICDGKEFNVVEARKKEGNVVHIIDEEGLKKNDNVKCIINWERRYKLMRSHTAIHIFCAIINKETGALITGNSITPEKIRVDLNLETFNRETAEKYIEKTNIAISRNLDVDSYVMTRDELEKNSSMIKLAKGLPSFIKEVRIVKIGDVDEQPDGGTHVKNTKEIGKLELIKCDNRGKENRRIYLNLIE